MVEIKDEFDFINWLKTQPQDVHCAISVQAALRVLPICVDLVEQDPQRRADALILPLFCTSAPPWVAGNWPTLGGEGLKSAARSAARCADTARSAARSAVLSANSAVSGYSAVRSVVWITVNQDVQVIDSGATASNLLAKPLWLDGTPEEMLEKWERLRVLLLEQDPNWWVWTDWYEDRLKGFEGGGARPLIEDLEVERVLIADEDWDKGPDHILPMLVEMEERRDDRDPKESQSFEQAGQPGSGSLHDKASIARFSIDGVINALVNSMPNEKKPQKEYRDLIQSLKVLRDEIDTLIAELQTEPETVETLKQERALIFQCKLNEIIAKADWVSHTDMAVRTTYIGALMAFAAFLSPWAFVPATIGACMIAGPKAAEGASNVLKSVVPFSGRKPRKTKTRTELLPQPA